jgi:hypothetical protein
VELTSEKFHKWQKDRIPLTNMRSDNAGENMTLEARSQSKDWQLNLEFDFTTGDTPHHTSLAQTSIANMANSGRSLEIQNLEGGISSGNGFRWIFSYCIV